MRDSDRQVSAFQALGPYKQLIIGSCLLLFTCLFESTLNAA